MSTTSAEEYSPRNYRVVFIVLSAGFVVAGFIGTLNGPILPTFIARWKLSDAGAGLFITALYLGSLAGTLLSSVVISRKGYRPTLVSGFALAAAGTAAVFQPSHKVALAATVVYGVGYGLLVPAANMWVAEYSAKRGASALNLLNLAWGIGAMGWPPIALYAIREQHLGGTLRGIGAGALLLAAMLWMSPFLPHTKKEGKQEAVGGGDGPGLWVIVGLAFLFFVYVGVENSISQWAAALAKRVLMPGDPSWALAPTLFFFGLLGGRGLASVVLLRVKDIWAVYGGVVLAGAATIVELQATRRATLLISVGAAGLGCSSVYPVFVAWLPKWFGTRARKIAGVMFSFASLGAASLPWLVGFVSKQANSLRVGLLVPVVGCVCMLVVTALVRAQMLRK